ncbi:hypothetical protein FRB90_001380, partial [Tulasnella sp. 427]
IPVHNLPVGIIEPAGLRVAVGVEFLVGRAAECDLRAGRGSVDGSFEKVGAGQQNIGRRSIYPPRLVQSAKASPPTGRSVKGRPEVVEKEKSTFGKEKEKKDQESDLPVPPPWTLNFALLDFQHGENVAAELASSSADDIDNDAG